MLDSLDTTCPKCHGKGKGQASSLNNIPASHHNAPQPTQTSSHPDGSGCAGINAGALFGIIAAKIAWLITGDAGFGLLALIVCIVIGFFIGLSADL